MVREGKWALTLANQVGITSNFDQVLIESSQDRSNVAGFEFPSKNRSNWLDSRIFSHFFGITFWG